MSIAEHMPTTTRGRWGTLTAAVALWVTAYWINGWLWDRVLYDVFGMAPDERLTETLHFFLYDTIKIALLLSGIIFVITILRSYMSVERTRALLGGRREGVGNVMAAGLGVITPFCSCSAVPAFIGFVAAGVPLGVTLSFLIASPLVNEIAIGLLLSLFGVQVTALYIGAGLLDRHRRRLGARPAAVGAVGGAVRVRDQARRPGHRLHRRPDLQPARPDGRRGGRHHPAQDLALPAGRHRPRRRHPRVGARGLLHPVRRTGERLRRAGRRRHRHPALLQRRRHPAPGRGAARQGPADGHPTGVHDGRRRAVPAGDDPASPRPQTAAARRLRRRRRRHPSSRSATCSTPYSPEPPHGSERKPS